MATGLSSKTLNNVEEINKVESFVPRRNHDPKDLRSWAKRTGFVSMFSGETDVQASSSSNGGNLRNSSRINSGNVSDLEKGSAKVEIDPILGRSRGGRDSEIEPINGGLQREGDRDEERKGVFEGNGKGLSSIDERRVGVGVGVGVNGNGDGNGNRNGRGFHEDNVAASEPVKEEVDGEDELGFGDGYFDEEPILGGQPKSFKVKCGVSDNPGLVPVIYYGLQQYLSITGSLILIPLIMVPAMGGSDKDTANVISTVLLVSGISTLLHSYFGTRLPLIQGSSFVYLAPALVIMNSQEFRNLADHVHYEGVARGYNHWFTFSEHIGIQWPYVSAIKVDEPSRSCTYNWCCRFSIFQLRVSSSRQLYRNKHTSNLIASLLHTGISNFLDPRQQLQVPLSIVIVWTYAVFLTVGGAYNFKGCSPNIPSSNILVDSCIKHAYTMKHCRTDVSNAWAASSWFRFPYPLQWGIPIFRFRTSIIMIIVSLVSSADSVGTYYSASLRVNIRPPTRGIVSRGIGVEGFCSLVAGLWGTGLGSTTLTENVHTISITDVANRRAVQLGAVLLILLSFLGKVGGIIASIPQALAASVLCFIWSLTVALGLLNLQYTQASSFRNMAIVGASLFLGLSVPAYIQQFQPEISLILPGYLITYAAASSGPVHSSNAQLDFAINGLLSMNMVVTFLLALVLDNTVPGSKQERGVYKWSSPEDLSSDEASQAAYRLPRGVARACCWARCLGVRS
ncbi:hypothetical protein KSS87_001422 [Heliosperma pusillum]|nr:hypothetical protein KSS87_001422 [Heliosperma pusillum]